MKTSDLLSNLFHWDYGNVAKWSHVGVNARKYNNLEKDGELLDTFTVADELLKPHF